MNIHHIGYAVKDIDVAIAEFKKLGFVKEGQTYSDDSRNIYVQFMLNNDNYRIELISEINGVSPISNILNKIGNTPYHICYQTDNINRSIDLLKFDKYKLLKKVQPAIAINNNKIAFLFKLNVGLIELVVHFKNLVSMNNVFYKNKKFPNSAET